MENWKKMLVGDVCDSISNSYCRKDDEVVLINTSDVLEGKILNHLSVQNKNLKGQFKKTFMKDDILYSEIRPANKRYAYVDFEETERYIASTKLMVLRARKELVLPRFLFCFFSSKPVLDELQHLAETRSGTFPQITFSSELANVPISVPDFKTQTKIVDILDAIEKRIETNQKINDNLSHQIQLIYDNLADSLTGDPVSLSTIIDVRDGTHDSPKAIDDGFPLVTSKHLLSYGVDLSTTNLISKEDFDKTNERSLVETHDILISMIGTVGLISLVIDDPVPFAIKNVGLFKTSKCPDLYAYILPYLRSTKTTQHIEKTLAGSTQKYISLGELRKMPIILPDENKLSDYNNIVVPLIMQITNLTEENKRLSELRDTLLPKLMAGELDVSNLDL